MAISQISVRGVGVCSAVADISNITRADMQRRIKTTIEEASTPSLIRDRQERYKSYTLSDKISDIANSEFKKFQNLKINNSNIDSSNKLQKHIKNLSEITKGMRLDISI